jgi:hypothetical protein
MAAKGEDHVDETFRPVVWHFFDIRKDKSDVWVVCGSHNDRHSLWKILTWRRMSAGRASVTFTDGEGASDWFGLEVSDDMPVACSRPVEFELLTTTSS